MSIPVLVELAIGDPTTSQTSGVTAVSLQEADDIVVAAAGAGVSAWRLLDRIGEERTVEPSLTAAHLAGRHPGTAFLADAPTTHNAPYNLARRVLSADRATGGAIGVVLRPGDGDEVTGADAPGLGGTTPTARWSEYADVVTRLWESFPQDALVGDQERAVVVDRTRITRIDHTGRFYRVSGPLDVPASDQGRPVVAGLAAELDWEVLAHHADLVVVDADDASGADEALTSALAATGRGRDDVRLLGRARVSASTAAEGVAVAASLRVRVEEQQLDGLLLVATGGSASALDVLEHLVPHLAGPASHSGATLRERLGLPSVASPLPVRTSGAVA